MGTKPKVRRLVQIIEALIEGHRNCLRSQALLHGSSFAELLEGYRASLDRFAKVKAEEAQESLPILRNLLDNFQEPHRAWAERQRSSADDFNLLETMGVHCKEVCHSRILAWLLDWRIDEYGTHAQRELGFRLFLQNLEKRLDPGSRHNVIAYAHDPSYWVRCEVPGRKSKIDVEIAAFGRFIIHIENKIQSPEGENETNREWEDLLERAKELEVPPENIHGIFLTLDGRRPKKLANNGFRPVGWARVARVIEEFAEQAEPDIVKLFARHYAAAVRKLAASKPQLKEIDDAEVMVQRTGAVPPEEMDGCTTA
jgi:hypothetical protein